MIWPVVENGWTGEIFLAFSKGTFDIEVVVDMGFDWFITREKNCISVRSQL